MAIIILVFSLMGVIFNFTSNTLPMSFGNNQAVTQVETSQPAYTSTPIDEEIKNEVDFNNQKDSTKAAAITAIAAIVFGVVLVVLVVALFIGTVFSGFTAFVALSTANNKTVTLEETFRAVFHKFWTILGINFVVFLKIFGGFLLFIVPGIRASLRYNMVLFPVFDKDAKAKEAIKTSKLITKNHLIEVFGMTFASGLIPLVGGLMQVGGQTIMYPQLRDLQASGAAKPKVHWLNYIGFILFGLLFGFVSLILLAVSLIILPS